jgi:hypothetical protein
MSRVKFCRNSKFCSKTGPWTSQIQKSVVKISLPSLGKLTNPQEK